MTRTWRMIGYLLLVAGLLLPPLTSYGNTISGPMEKWKPILIDFNGPFHSEMDSSTNPFLYYRLQVRFTHADSGTNYWVPGFFAGDGNGGGTGRVWRVYFSADQTGTWSYEAYFRSGQNIAISLAPQDGSPVAFNGETGSFTVSNPASDASLFYQGGRLESVGDYYFKFRDGGYWIKGGLNSPENFLGYSGFDNTPNALHSYSDFINDWQSGDPDWDSPDTSETANDGRAIIGLLNYLSGRGMNSIYFMPMTIGADGKDTWPYASETIDRHGSSANDNLHFDISKLEQWQLALSHAQEKGIFLHFVLSDKEQDNKNELDSATLGIERKLFYRELIARFGHHNALQWNICEEYNIGGLPLDPDVIKDFAQYIKSVDPYDHPITIHSNGNTYAVALAPFVGDDRFGVMSIQTWQRPDDVGSAIEHFRSTSLASGLPVPSSADESIGINQISFNDYRKRVIWDAFFSGGMQEYFVIHQDYTLEDFRQFEDLFEYSTTARNFMESELPFWEMEPDDSLVAGADTLHGGAEVFVKHGEIYAIFFPKSDMASYLDLNGVSGQFSKRWFNPRSGIYEGPKEIVTAGANISIGMPPDDAQEDWVVLFTLMEVAQTPLINPSNGTYYDAAGISMSSTTPGASIYYTTNGDDPDQGDQLYSAPFEITSNATVKARAYAEDYTPSEVASADYIIKPTPQAAAPQINPATGTYNNAARVTLSSATSNVAIYYTTDGADPDQNCEYYTAPFEITSDATVKARAYSTGYTPSDITKAVFVIIPQPTDEPEDPPSAPVVDPANDTPGNPPPAAGPSGGGGGGGGCFISALH